MKITRKLFGALVALLAALTFTTVGASAAGRGPGMGGGGGGGGGEPPTTEASNNLSVPGVFIGSTGGFSLQNTTGELAEPQGEPTSGWPIDPLAYYYVQRLNTWQAEYVVKTSDTVTADWGDNLSGDARLKVGSPVRVEMVLFSTTEASTMLGYSVQKLEPDKLDREAAYGTPATAGTEGYSATSTILPARVWGSGATVTITGPAPSTTQLIGQMPGEINATGGLVFGFNWRPTQAGEYELRFNPPAGVTILDPLPDDGIDPAVIGATVTGGGGGGGGGQGRVR